MLIRSSLYIVLGFSLGVGVTLIYLQERFLRERRKLRALDIAERAKSQEIIKELDAKWEKETIECRREIADAHLQIAGYEEAALISETKVKELEEIIVAYAEKADKVEETEQRCTVDRAAITELQLTLQEKEEELAGLLKEKNDLLGTLTEARQEISDLHGEIEFLKGKITNIENQRKKSEQDDDFLVMTPGHHYIPGSVVRSLMGKKRGSE